MEWSVSAQEEEIVFAAEADSGADEGEEEANPVLLSAAAESAEEITPAPMLSPAIHEELLEKWNNTEGAKDGGWETEKESGYLTEEEMAELEQLEEELGLNASENEDQEGKLVLDVQPETASPKAGESLLYQVTLKNTGEAELKNICAQYYFSPTGLVGLWEAADEMSLETLGNGAIIESLMPGEERKLYLSAALSEDQAEAVELKINAMAYYQTAQGEMSLSENKSIRTEIGALKADFEVTKTADRSVAAPGDKILFQICIRNTGERTLHSVISTEKFKRNGIPVKFLEKEGVTLNKDKTKARIDEIKPGCAVSLQAEITLPKDTVSQELINEVTVTAAETGDKTVTSQAKVQIYQSVDETEKTEEKNEEEKEKEPEKTAGTADDPGSGSGGENSSGKEAPKTGDETPILLFVLLICAAGSVTGFLLYRRKSENDDSM